MCLALQPLVFFMLVQAVTSQPRCPDGSAPQCPDGSPLQAAFPPCRGGPPHCSDGSVLPPPRGGQRPPGALGPQGAQPPFMGGGAMPGGPPVFRNGGAQPGGPPPPGVGQVPNGLGGGVFPIASSNPHAAPLLGDVGKTITTGRNSRTGKVFNVGEDIYGPFEAGFSSDQDFVLQRIGCAQPSLGYVAGGVDTHTAERMMAHQCNIQLPRVINSGPQGYISLLDECGGHTPEYHFHESMVCLYQGRSNMHSTKIGEGNKGGALYGKWEHTERRELPLLDACGGHYGRTPESPDKDVYHHHVQDQPPFTFGCYGPNDDGSLVTVEQCRSFYGGCDGNVVTVHTPEGSRQYDDWCPCFDAKGSNSGKGIATLAVFAAHTHVKGAMQKAAILPSGTLDSKLGLSIVAALASFAAHLS